MEKRNKPCSSQKLVEHRRSCDLRGTFCLSTMADLLPPSPPQPVLDGVFSTYTRTTHGYTLPRLNRIPACRRCFLTDGKFYKRTFSGCFTFILVTAKFDEENCRETRDTFHVGSFHLLSRSLRFSCFPRF